MKTRWHSFWNEDGTLKRVTDLTADQGAAPASFEVVIKNAAAGDGHTDTVQRIKLWDKIRALEMLAKHFALLTDVVRHDGLTQELLERLARGRQRNAERE